MPDCIRVGLIGYGMAGRVFHAPLIRAVQTLELKAIATSRTEEVAALDPAIVCVSDADAIFVDPTIDLVVIATPSATHADLAERALRSGKHVVVDKPFALTLDDARESARIAEDTGRHLIVFHNRRFDSDFLSVQQAIEDGLVGHITHFESHFDRFRPQVRNRWRENGSPGSGVWFDLGPHLVDQALCLFGRPEAVQADIAALRSGSAADDWAHVVLRYDDKRVVLHASLLSPGAGDGGSPRFSVHGTAGTIIKRALDVQETQLTAGLRPGDAGWGVDPDPLLVLAPDDSRRERPAAQGRQELFYAGVASALTHGAPPPISISEALAVQEVMEAAIRSARDGSLVSLPISA